MAKKSDPFEKFRNATLGGDDALRGALSGNDKSREVSPAPTQVQAPSPTLPKVSKNANRKMISFHIDKDLHYILGQLKFELGVKYDDIYNEAIRDLLVKYGKI